MTFRPRQYEDDIYPLDEDEHLFDHYEPDPDHLRDLQMEREWETEALISAEEESRWLAEADERMWAEARFKDVQMLRTPPHVFEASLLPIDSDWKRDLRDRAYKVPGVQAYGRGPGR